MAHRALERKGLGGVGSQGRLRALKRAGGMKVRALWRTGLMPAGSPDAGVVGVTDKTLISLRSFAGELAGARRWPVPPSRPSWPPRKTKIYDPGFEATCPLIARSCAWVWDGLTSLVGHYTATISREVGELEELLRAHLGSLPVAPPRRLGHGVAPRAALGPWQGYLVVPDVSQRSPGPSQGGHRAMAVTPCTESPS